MKSFIKWLVGLFIPVTMASAGIGGALEMDKNINPYTDKGDKLEMAFAPDEKNATEMKIEIIKDNPEIRLKRWGEIDLGIRYDDVQASGDRTFLSDKVEWKSAKEEVHAYPLAEGLEFEVILKEKPNKNVFNFQLENWENLNFYPQHFITPEEIANGDTQPENVGGSYAIYYKSGNQYGTGKFGHIYRPKAIDKDGQEVWAILRYSNGVLSVTVPQDFLDNANYPVRVDPTFGKTTDGASSSNSATERKVVSRATPATSGTVSSATFRIWLGSAGSGNSSAVIYSSVSDAPSALLAVGDTVAFTNTSEGAVTSNFTGVNAISVVAGTQYWIGYRTGDTSGIAVHQSRDDTGGQQCRDNDTFSDGAEDPFGTCSQANGPIDAFVTYTEPVAAGGRPKATIRSRTIINGRVILP